MHKSTETSVIVRMSVQEAAWLYQSVKDESDGDGENPRERFFDELIDSLDQYEDEA